MGGDPGGGGGEGNGGHVPPIFLMGPCSNHFTFIFGRVFFPLPPPPAPPNLDEKSPPLCTNDIFFPLKVEYRIWECKKSMKGEADLTT